MQGAVHAALAPPELRDEEEKPEQPERDHPRVAARPRSAPVVRHGDVVLHLPDEEQQRRRDEIESDDLHRHRRAGRDAGRHEPAPLSSRHPAQHRRNAEEREKERIPRGQRMRRKRQRPERHAHGEQRGAPRGKQSPGRNEHRGERHEPCAGNHGAECRQPLPEHAEGRGVQVVESPRPEGDEVAVRKLAVHHAVRTLRENSFVRRRPAHVQMRTHGNICQRERTAERQQLGCALARRATQPRAPWRSTCRTPSSCPRQCRQPTGLRSDGARA